MIAPVADAQSKDNYMQHPKLTVNIFLYFFSKPYAKKESTLEAIREHFMPKKLPRTLLSPESAPTFLSNIHSFRFSKLKWFTEFGRLNRDSKCPLLALSGPSKGPRIVESAMNKN
jgi:hypothetical protein